MVSHSEAGGARAGFSVSCSWDVSWTVHPVAFPGILGLVSEPGVCACGSCELLHRTAVTKPPMSLY